MQTKIREVQIQTLNQALFLALKLRKKILILDYLSTSCNSQNGYMTFEITKKNFFLKQCWCITFAPQLRENVITDFHFPYGLCRMWLRG